MNIQKFMSTVFLVIFSVVLTGQNLENSFLKPPDSAKPWVFWFWINGNISKEGITKDLEAMKAAGINGVIWMEVSGKYWAPKGNIHGGTPQWTSMMQWAISEADRLGMEFDLSVSFGYGAGGPWIEPDKSMQKLVWIETSIEGGNEINISLEKPALKTNLVNLNEQYQGLAAVYKQEDDFKKELNDAYKDIAIFAIKTDSQKIARINDKDLPLLSGLGWETQLPEIQITKLSNTLKQQEVIDLTDKINAKGELNWSSPPGNWQVIRLGQIGTGKLARPCPDAVVGLESDRLNPQGIEAHFESFLKPILKGAGDAAGRTLKYIHIDSWEAKGQNWGKDFAEEFKKRRGYDITPWLPALTGLIVENEELTRRFLWDMRQTVSDVMLDNYIGRLKELIKPYGVKFSSESYGHFCVDNLTYGGRAELPIAEFWTEKQFGAKRPDFESFTKPAKFSEYCYSTLKALASVANTYGRARTGAEAFTGSRGWVDHPWMLKNMGDEAFSEGINLFIYHLYAHQPYDNMVPGLTHRRWGQHMNRFQPWWNLSMPYFEYISRAQAVLQQGRTVVDFACLLKEGAPNNIMNGGHATFNCPPGYDFDFCSAEIIQRMEYKDGYIYLPTGASYKYLVLPKDGRLTLNTAEKIDELYKAGATIYKQVEIVGTPGLTGFPQANEKVIAMSKYWPILPEGGWKAVLADDNLKQDFTGEGLNWIHRRSGSDDIYFVANSKLENYTQRCAFRVSGKTPELWDPLTGKMYKIPVTQQADGLTAIDLQFEPSQSWFVVFRDKPSSDLLEKNPFLTWEDVQEITTQWEVCFDPQWGSSKPIKLNQLSSWSEQSDPLVKYYSGTGTYKTTFELEDTSIKNNLYLDLGEVAVIARVKLNGKDCGIAWQPPYRVDISHAVKAGKNELVIEVANTWVNRLIGDEQLPLDSKWKNWETLAEWPDWFKNNTERTSGRYTFTSCRHYTKENQPMPSGLLGPVKVQYSKGYGSKN